MISSQDENGYITLEFQKLHVIGLKTLSQLKSDVVIIALVSKVYVLVALSKGIPTFKSWGLTWFQKISVHFYLVKIDKKGYFWQNEFYFSSIVYHVCR